MALLQSIDHGILQSATRLGGTSPIRDDIVFLIAEVLPYCFLLVAIYLFFVGKTKRRREKNQNVLFITAAAVLMAVGIRFLMIQAYHRPRPFVSDPALHHLHAVPTSAASFPSLHAFILFTAAGTIFFIGQNRKLGWLLLFLASVIVMARVVAGVHYPSDVVVGAALGLGLARLISWQSKWTYEQVR